LIFKIPNNKTQSPNKSQMPNIKNIHLDFLIWYLIVIWILIFGIF